MLKEVRHQRHANRLEVFDFDDVALVPAMCQVKSRSECDPSIVFGPKRFRLPVIPANMSAVIDEELAEMFAKNDYFYV